MPEREKLRRLLRADVKAFLNQNPTVVSGRVLARIFQGLSSPCYALEMWRASPFWARYVNLRFEDIWEMAEEELRIARGACLTIEELRAVASRDGKAS